MANYQEHLKLLDPLQEISYFSDVGHFLEAQHNIHQFVEFFASFLLVTADRNIESSENKEKIVSDMQDVHAVVSEGRKIIRKVIYSELSGEKYQKQRQELELYEAELIFIEKIIIIRKAYRQTVSPDIFADDFNIGNDYIRSDSDEEFQRITSHLRKKMEQKYEPYIYPSVRKEDIHTIGEEMERKIQWCLENAPIVSAMKMAHTVDREDVDSFYKTAQELIRAKTGKDADWSMRREKDREIFKSTFGFSFQPIGHVIQGICESTDGKKALELLKKLKEISEQMNAIDMSKKLIQGSRAKEIQMFLAEVADFLNAKQDEYVTADTTKLVKLFHPLWYRFCPGMKSGVITGREEF